jgi:pyruvate/2-oxoglutarate dehydrogenase complex dihydrolipoamide acyltransferase (E2) component
MFEVVLTKFTHDMEGAVVVEWLKAEGDAVEKGEPIVCVETDKAAVELEADTSGTLAGICVAAGDVVPVGTRLAYLLA